jgi:hypothetical protein
MAPTALEKLMETKKEKASPEPQKA